MLFVFFSGVAEVQEGEVNENELKTETTGITRMSFAKDPETKKASDKNTYMNHGIVLVKAKIKR